MRATPVYHPGESVEIVLGCQWYPATIVGSFQWSDARGNTCVSYKVDISTGIIRAGPNSLRAARKLG
jgi:hypothetical protein